MDPNPKRRETEMEKPEEILDPFQKLPEDVIIFIFSKLPDLKFLCQCSMVSKLFSSTTYLVTDVTFKLPAIKYVYHTPRTRLPILDPHKHYIRTGNALNSLTKFRQIRFLKFQWDGNCVFVDWKANFGTKLDTVAFLPYGDFSKHVQGRKETGGNFRPTPQQLKDLLEMAVNCFRDVTMWHRFLIYVIQQPLPETLESVTVGDLHTQRGVFCVSGKRLVELRNELGKKPIYFMAFDDLTCVKGIKSVKFCHIPMLRLPSLGLTMKRLGLIIFRVGEKVYARNNDNNGGDNAVDGGNAGQVYNNLTVHNGTKELEFEEEEKVFNWEFDEDEKLFKEAATLIMKNHKDKMISISRKR